MDLDQSIFENADLLAATGVSATTIQTWANRGILALSKKQQNPGGGAKRLYSGLDIARIAATNAFIARGLSTAAAGRIALRLERSRRTAEKWRKALDEPKPCVYVFVADADVVDVYTGNDARAALSHLTTLNEPAKGGVLGEATTVQMNVSCFDVGPEVYRAMQTLKKRKGE